MGIFNIRGAPLSEAYNLTGNSITEAFDVSGNIVYRKSGINYSSYTSQASCINSGVANDQGFDVYNGFIFQLHADDSATVINATTGAIVNQFSCRTGHGDSAYFSREFYDPSDEYPLLYVSADTTPYVFVNRVTASSSQLIKSYKFDNSIAGYNPNAAYDEDNQILYMVGTTKDDWLTDVGGTNETLISKWDMTNITENGDGTFTPQFVSSYTIPFIYVMQGIRYHDGMIWIPSGYGNKPSYLYAINPETGVYEYTFNLNTTVEVEGTAFLSATQMLVGFQGGRYDLYTFALSS